MLPSRSSVRHRNISSPTTRRPTIRSITVLEHLQGDRVSQPSTQSTPVTLGQHAGGSIAGAASSYSGSFDSGAQALSAEGDLSGDHARQEGHQDHQQQNFVWRDEETRAAAFAEMQEVIKGIHQTLLILDHDALVLTRAWVLWELHQTLQSHKQLPGCVVVLAYGVQWSFVMQELVLCTHFDAADAADKADLKFIREQMSKLPEGPVEASRAVAQAISRSAARQAKHAEKLLLTANNGCPNLYIGLRVQQGIMGRVEGRLLDAERMIWSILDYMFRGLHGELEDLGFAVGALVDIMVASDKPEELHRAASLCHIAQERLERCLGPEHSVCLRISASHAWTLLRAGQVQAAEQLSRLVLSRQEKLHRPCHEVLDTLFSLATVHRAMGQTEEAEGQLLRAAELGERVLGWGHPQCAVALTLLGEWCYDAGRCEDAAVWLVQARAAMSRVYSRDSHSWVRATLQLTDCLTQMGELDAAQKLLVGLLTKKARSVKGSHAGALGLGTGPTAASGLVSGTALAGATVLNVAGSSAVQLQPPASQAQPQASVPPQQQLPPTTCTLSDANFDREMGGLMFDILQQLMQVLVTSTRPPRNSSWHHAPKPVSLPQIGSSENNIRGFTPLAPQSPMPAARGAATPLSPSSQEQGQIQGLAPPLSPVTAPPLSPGSIPLPPGLASRLPAQGRMSKAAGCLWDIGDIDDDAANATGVLSAHAPSTPTLRQTVALLRKSRARSRRLLQGPSKLRLQERATALQKPNAVALLLSELQGEPSAKNLGRERAHGEGDDAGDVPGEQPQEQEPQSLEHGEGEEHGGEQGNETEEQEEEEEEEGEDAPLHTMADVFPDCTITVVRLLRLYEMDRRKAEVEALAAGHGRLSGSGKYGLGHRGGHKPSSLLPHTLHRRALADASLTAIGAGKGSGAEDAARTVFTARPHERKFKVRKRNLMAALLPLSAGGTALAIEGSLSKSTGDLRLAALGASSSTGGGAGVLNNTGRLAALASAGLLTDGSVSESDLPGKACNAGSSLDAKQSGRPGRITPSVGDAVAQTPDSQTLAADADTGALAAEDDIPASLVRPGPPLPIPPERRRAALVALSITLQQHGEQLRAGGDEVGCALAQHLGLAIAQQLTGPGEPAAVASVAAVVDLLVSRRRFLEAKRQLAYRLELPSMTAGSKDFLRGQVGRCMTDAAFKAVAEGDCETLIAALELGASTVKKGKQLLVAAASHGQREMVSELLRLDPSLVEMADADTGMHALATAAALGHTMIAEDLLAQPRTQVDAIDLHFRTAMVHAALAAQLPLVTTLIAAGANVNARFSNASSALMSAAARGDGELLQLLLQYGAEVDAQDQRGHSALFHAVLAGHTFVIAALLHAGCGANLKDSDGCTPLIYAARMNSVEMVTLLVGYKVDLNLTDARGMTALMTAAAHGRAQIVDLLLSQQVKIQVQDCEGQSALMHAAKSGHLTVCCALLIRASTQEGGMPLTLGDPNTQTAIQLRVDRALAKVGAKLATNAEVAAAVAEVHRVAGIALASSDANTCLEALEALRQTAGMVNLVRTYACMYDKSGKTAADWAKSQGFEELAIELRRFTKQRNDFL